MIVKDCYSSFADMALWRVDITNDAQGKSASEQQALPNNTRLLKYADGQHVSTVAIGDWAFISTEDGTDTFNSGTAGWYAYRQEIIALNVITGEVRRLAHHRSRSVDAEYRSQPRVSAGWSGKVVGFASNFNQPGGGTPVVDIFAIPFPLSSGGRRDHPGRRLDRYRPGGCRWQLPVQDATLRLLGRGRVSPANHVRRRLC